MLGLVVTSVVNIILNYVFIFIFHWGVKGSAYATIIGTFIGILVLLTHFWTSKNQLRVVRTKLDLPMLGNIFVIGFPSFIVEGTFAVMIIAFNITFSHHTGETGLVAYSVVNYMHAVLICSHRCGVAVQHYQLLSWGKHYPNVTNSNSA